MQWSDVRNAYPNQWLIIEALQAHTTSENHRILEKIAIIERCLDGNSAMQNYRQLHQQYSTREFYFVHTGREDLEINDPGKNKTMDVGMVVEKPSLGLKAEETKLGRAELRIFPSS